MLKAFGDLCRRTFHDLNDDWVVQGYARFILPMLGIGIDHEHQARYSALVDSSRWALPIHWAISTGISGPGSSGRLRMCAVSSTCSAPQARGRSTSQMISSSPAVLTTV